MRTSRAGLAGWLFEVMRFMSQALEACSRVLKKRAAQSHLSMRVPVMLSIFVDFYGLRLDGAEHAAGKVEERGDEFEGAADYDAYEAEGQQNQPDERIQQERDQGDGPADDQEETEEQEFEHRNFLSLKDNV